MTDKQKIDKIIEALGCCSIVEVQRFRVLMAELTAPEPVAKPMKPIPSPKKRKKRSGG